MSRRKQAKPRSLKRDEGTEICKEMFPIDDNNIKPVLQELFVDVEGNQHEPFESAPTTEHSSVSSNHSYSTMDSEALETEGGGSSSWSSSCPTPEPDLSFTVGVTETTPYACQFCDKAFPRLSYLKKHEQTHSEHMPFRCEYCSRLFKHKRSRDRHIKLHTGDKKYRCTQCDAAFSRSDHLKIHLKTHDNQKPFQCTICNRGYNTAAALTSHLQNHKRASENDSNTISRNLFKCLQCTESYQTPEELTAHMKVHNTTNNDNKRKTSQSFNSNIPYSCLFCAKDNFTTIESLHLHLQSMHGILQGDQLKQNLMSKVTSTSISYSDKLFTQASPISCCPFCLMSFPNLQTMKHHIALVHDFSQLPQTVQSPSISQFKWEHPSTPPSTFEQIVNYRIKDAERTSPSKLSIQNGPTDLSLGKRSQTESHTNSAKKTCTENSEQNNSSIPMSNSQKPTAFLCNQCHASCPDFESFRIHQRSHLEGSIQTIKMNQIYCCPHCTTCFSNLEELSPHVTSHFLSMIIEFICNYCQKAFEKNEELQNHMLELHSQCIYTCTLCNRLFSSKKDISIHLMHEHSNGNKKFQCTACPSVFHTEVEFSVHVSLSHDPYNLTSHRESLQSPRLHRCKYCFSRFPNEIDLQYHHLAVHTKQFKCKYCSEMFHVEYLLDKHIETVHDNQKIISQINDDKSQNTIEVNMETNNFDDEKINNDHDQNEFIDKKDVRLSIANINNTNSNSKSIKHKVENIKLNNNNSPCVCDICQYSQFNSEAELIAHRKLAHNVTSHSNTKLSPYCVYCKENFKTRIDLENHMKTHTNLNTKHKCNICDEICQSATDLAEHKLSHCKVLHERTCTNCKISVLNEDEFFVHLIQHSSNNGQQNIIFPTGCIVCKQTLHSKMEARLHAKFHLETYQTKCRLCNVKLENNSDISGVCGNCSIIKDENQKSILNDEILAENCIKDSIKYQIQNIKSKILNCNICEINFDNEEDSEAHLAHIHAKDVRKCWFCMSILPDAHQLQIHLIEHNFIHTTYSCFVCNTDFKDAVELQAHMNCHSQSTKPFICPSCPLKFFFKAERDNHYFIHDQLSTEKVDVAKHENELSSESRDTPKNKYKKMNINKKKIYHDKLKQNAQETEIKVSNQNGEHATQVE